MAKYKVGDKVRIVSKRPNAIGFTDAMEKYLGKTLTVINVRERPYGLSTYNLKEATVGNPSMDAAKEKRYSAILEAQAEATLDLYDAQADLIAITNEFNSAQTQLQAELGYTAEEVDHLADIFVLQNGYVAACAAITYAKTEAGSVTFVCLDEAPGVDIPVIVEVSR